MGPTAAEQRIEGTFLADAYKAAIIARERRADPTREATERGVLATSRTSASDAAKLTFDTDV